LPRFSARFAVALLVALSAAQSRAEMISTHCAESEITLDGHYSVARLDRCGADVDDGAEPLLWHLDRIDQIGSTLDGQVDRGNGGAGSVIYVMDTGVMASHVEFTTASFLSSTVPTASRVIAGYDATGSVEIGRSRCASPDKSVAPCYDRLDELAAASHGTSVASIAAGRNVGVAPYALVVSIRVMNERGLATTRTYLDGLEAIVRHAWDPSSPNMRTAVVNISGWVLERLSNTQNADPVAYATVEQKIRDMIGGVDANGRPDPNGKRFLFVVAANNVDGGCGASGIIDRFPALLGTRIEGLITVGGMTAENTNWIGTCRGGVEVLAPAQSIFSATITAADHYRGRRPNLRSGTSFAAPIISGIAARLLSDRPDLSPQQLEAWITATPSRVYDPTVPMAEGRVAYVKSIARATPVSARAMSRP
jgi:subtilisin family serine protease